MKESPVFPRNICLFAAIPNPSKFKQFRKGVDELREEGAVQIMYSADEAKRDPILAASGSNYN